MIQWILFTPFLVSLLTLNSFALEVTMNSAKDDFSRYSTLTLSDKNSFVCQEMKNDFDVTTEIICAFSKKPSSDISQLQNDFFKVNTLIKKDTFFIRIEPFYKIKLIPQIFDLSKDDTIYKADITVSNIWNIIGYKDKLPLINNKEKSAISINFPFYSDKDKLPYVGSLDIKGNPVHIKKVGDVRDYLKVKELYKEKKYSRCMGVVEDILEEYPDTLFRAELIYYRIKLYAKLKDYDNVISDAKEYLREYSANENIPEVLAFTAQAYSQIGMNIDADYFFDRLFSEHENSVYTLWGYIYKGEMLELSGSTQPALKFYKKALYKTADLEVAATAAFDIAHLRLEVSHEDSAKYIKKIVAAKPSYFYEKYKVSKSMMHSFADESYFDTAAKIAKALLEKMNRDNDDYEKMLSERGLWLAQTPNKQEALEAINRYIKEFDEGEYIAEVQIAKDSLFFDSSSDINTTAKLAEYDKLIQEYAGDTIGQRAVYEKAKLLLSAEMYLEVLDMQETLLSIDEEKYADVNELIKSAAVGVMESSLDLKKCKEVLVIANDYNITLSNSWDDGIYECAMKGGDYELSKSIAKKNFKSKDLEFRKKWLYRYIKVDFATGNYSDVIGASKDLITLIQNDKESEYKDVYRYLFDTYDRLEQKENMITSIVKVEEVFGLNYKDIERYVSLMSIGSDRKDDTMVIQYGEKVTKIQKRSSSWAQSPYVEFTLYQAYMNKEEYQKALETIKLLDTLTLKKSENARASYMKGSVLNKLWRDDEAEVAYKAAIEADPESAWAKLAKSALKI